MAKKYDARCRGEPTSTDPDQDGAGSVLGEADRGEGTRTCQPDPVADYARTVEFARMRLDALFATLPDDFGGR